MDSKTNQTSISLVIQAGGKSSRMGESKVLMPFLGVPLIQRVFERTNEIAQEVLIVSNDPEELEFMDVKLVSDSIPGKGAIGGLFTAMDKASSELVAVVACDLPFVSAAILKEGARLLDLTGADVAIPRVNGDFYEPLHAVYRRQTCKTAILQAIQADQRRLISWFASVQVLEMDEELCKQLDPDGLAFFNINNKEDFLLAEQIEMRKSK
ncbi:MAG TPA: molybdenum cofactor guanylyltransferase [Chloroflexi bacterium]|jgi:molybdopterin-guanine dinucleotide biosynthesis protein A|nr:molybdenum cofactor guanylyltransferase [Anaerolineaceae bacterium]MDY0126428.1 molybdenum cofactor guanylyltransferase [Anaerolineaceae bacterium]HHX09553.1 molybdenum cofactor guanylyltransferase [Chloroflexota bacterium]